MDTFNAIVTGLADGWFRLFAGVAPQLPLVTGAILAGAVSAWLFGRLTNQRALHAAADQVRAGLLAVRLFRHDPRTTWQAQADLLRAAARRGWHSLPALAVLTPILALVLIQFALRYEHRPLRPGESVLVELQLDPAAWATASEIPLAGANGAVVETPALRDAKRASVAWRVRADQAGSLPLRWQTDRRAISHPLVVQSGSRGLLTVPARRPGPGWWDRLLHPGEPSLPRGGPVRAVVVGYPRRATPLLGVNPPWWLSFTVVSLGAAWIAGRWLGVRF